MSDTPKTDDLLSLIGSVLRVRERESNGMKDKISQLEKQIEFFRKGIRMRDAELKKLRNHEYICKKCGLRKDSKTIKADF